ncbi:MAG: prepilin peptidase [Patescibacteria group bacterium]
MIPFFYISIFILGTLIGSFLNVLVLRYNTGQSIVNDRSRCFSCGKTLKWFELIPVLSFVFQGGRCSNCHTKISRQYILVEIMTGLVFVAIFWKIFSLTPDFLSLFYTLIFELIFYLIIFSILIAISVYDYKHKIIPEALVYTFIGLSFLFALYVFFGQGIYGNLIAGPLLALPFFLLWLISRGAWMGFGDVKLSFGIGFLLGLPSGIYALILAFWIGGGVGFVLLGLSAISKNSVNNGRLLILGKRFTIKSEIPFGPFLILGTLLAFLFEWDFLHLKIILDLF